MALAIYVTRKNRDAMAQKFGLDLVEHATGSFIVQEKFKAPVVLTWDEFYATYPLSTGIPADEFEWFDV